MVTDLFFHLREDASNKLCGKKIAYHNSSVTAFKAQVWMELACSIKVSRDVHVPSHRRFTSNCRQGPDRFHLTSTCGPSPLESETKRKHIIWRSEIGERIWSNWQCQDSESLAVSLPRPRTEHDAGGLVKCAHFTHHFTWGAHTGFRHSTWQRTQCLGRTLRCCIALLNILKEYAESSWNHAAGFVWAGLIEIFAQGNSCYVGRKGKDQYNSTESPQVG